MSRCSGISPCIETALGELPGCSCCRREGAGAFWAVGEEAEEEGVEDGQEVAVALGGVVKEAGGAASAGTGAPQ